MWFSRESPEWRVCTSNEAGTGGVPGRSGPVAQARLGEDKVAGVETATPVFERPFKHDHRFKRAVTMSKNAVAGLKPHERSAAIAEL